MAKIQPPGSIVNLNISCDIFCISTTSIDGDWPYIKLIDNMKFKLVVNAQKAFWICLGIADKQQWGVVAKSDTFGSYTFVLPVAVSNVLVATSAIKGWNNTANNLCWHCVGTTSGPNDIVVTWNCYENRTRISYVGYIALCI